MPSVLVSRIASFRIGWAASVLLSGGRGSGPVAYAPAPSSRWAERDSHGCCDLPGGGASHA